MSSIKKEDLELAKLMLALADVNEEGGNYSEALRYLEEAKMLFQQTSNDLDYFTCLTHQAAICTRTGKLEAAQQLYEKHNDLVAVVIKELNNSPAVYPYKNALADSWERLARLCFQRKQFDEAIILLKQAFELFWELVQDVPEGLNDNYQRSAINALGSLGDVHLSMKNYDQAHSCFTEYHKLTAAFAETHPDNIEPRFDYAKSLARLAALNVSSGELSLALKQYKQALKSFRKQIELNKNLTDIKFEYITTLEKIGQLYQLLNNKKLAWRCLLASYEMMRDFSDDFQENIWYKEILAHSLNRLGDICQANRLYEDALGYYERCLKLKSDLSTAQPDVIQMKNALAVIHHSIGDAHKEIGNYGAAMTNYEAAYKIARKIQRYHSPYPDQKNLLVVSLGRKAAVHFEQKAYPEALKLMQKARKIAQQLSDDFPDNAAYQDSLAILFQDIASVYMSMDNYPRALLFFKKYYTLQAALAATAPDNYEYQRGLSISLHKSGLACMEMGKFKQALSYFQEFNKLHLVILAAAIGINRNLAKNDLAVSYDLLGDAHCQLQQTDEAVHVYQQFYEIITSLYEANKEDNMLLFNKAQSCLKMAIAGQIKGDEAQALLFLKDARQYYHILAEQNPAAEAYQRRLEEINEWERSLSLQEVV